VLRQAFEFRYEIVQLPQQLVGVGGHCAPPDCDLTYHTVRPAAVPANAQ
jgi:hypothetical protein